MRGSRRIWGIVALLGLATLTSACATTSTAPAVHVSTSTSTSTSTSPPPTTWPPAHPHEVVVLGDSTAMNLALALEATAPTGVTVVDGSNFGCGLAIAEGISARPPGELFAMFPACNSATPTSQQWPALDAAAVASTQPGDLVLFVGGKWEVDDIRQNGQWTDLTHPSFRQYERGQLRLLAQVATAHGAQLELATMPAMAPNSDGFTETLAQSTERRLLYDQLLTATARQFPSTVRVVDYGDLLTPKGVYRRYDGGVELRTEDGIHTPSYAPGNPYSGNSSQAVAEAFYAWIGPKLWPLMLGSSPAPTS